MVVPRAEPIWKTFFEIEPAKVVLDGPRKHGTAIFWGLYEDNDRTKRLLAIAGAGADRLRVSHWCELHHLRTLALKRAGSSQTRKRLGRCSASMPARANSSHRD
jgi:hypothetical protein